ncbi:D-alanyl-D-alanine carboxypeptidase family protein [Marinicrinis lubricantis]|uniref:D-alanyl-D-alanine carboxypeptidase family protein n=1 Tax=Marinicrinis lubricantis TaxID=2086470 RepID=A0ABW1IK46_9BACL
MKLRKVMLLLIAFYSLSLISDKFGLAWWEKLNTRSSDKIFATQQLIASSAILIDRETGNILFYKNDKEKVYPASTTKILTALVALDKGDPDEIVTVGNEVHLRTEGESTAWLWEGQQMPLRDMIAAMMLPSGNDAARTLAVHISRKVSGSSEMSAEQAIAYFAELMNKKAHLLGANDSHFVNPHGLHDPDHYTTARDLALIAKEAMNEPLLLDIVSSSRYEANTSSQAVTYTNRNHLLDPASPYFFEGANGIKTGFTDEAGYCLVSSAQRGDTSLIAVVLHSTTEGVWQDARNLLTYGFDETWQIAMSDH